VYADYCHVAFPTTTSVASTITLDEGSSATGQTYGMNSAGLTVSVVTTTVISAAGGSGSSSGGKSLSRSDAIAVVMGILAVLATGVAAFTARHTIVKIVRDSPSIFASS
jgi:hypothetical protein